MEIEKYFNEKSGVFTALAIFITFMVLSEEKSLFLSFSGFFISFILLSYLVNGFEKLDKFDVWGWLLFFGYTILFLALFFYGINSYASLFKGSFLTILLFIVSCFYVIVIFKTLSKQIKNLKKTKVSPKTLFKQIKNSPKKAKIFLFRLLLSKKHQQQKVTSLIG